MNAINSGTTNMEKRTIHLIPPNNIYYVNESFFLAHIDIIWGSD